MYLLYTVTGQYIYIYIYYFPVNKKSLKIQKVKDLEVFTTVEHIVLQMENCSDGFNVPREHTAKLCIVGKRIMGSIGKWCSYE
jgi:hypothetical protein